MECLHITKEIMVLILLLGSNFCRPFQGQQLVPLKRCPYLVPWAIFMLMCRSRFISSYLLDGLLFTPHWWLPHLQPWHPILLQISNCQHWHPSPPWHRHQKKNWTGKSPFILFWYSVEPPGHFQSASRSASSDAEWPTHRESKSAEPPTNRNCPSFAWGALKRDSGVLSAWTC